MTFMLILLLHSLKDDTLALSIVRKWAFEIRRRRESLEDDSRSRRPVITTTEENSDRVDMRLTISQITREYSVQLT